MDIQTFIEKTKALGVEVVQTSTTVIVPCPFSDHHDLLKGRSASIIIGKQTRIGKGPLCNHEGHIEEIFNELDKRTSNTGGMVEAQYHIASTTQISSKFGFTSLEDLLNEPDEEISWIVDGMLPSGGFSLMVAKPKVGKSTLVRQLALAVTNGELFLDRKTTKGAVLYVSLEEKRGEVRNHFRLMGANGTEDLGVYVGSTPEGAYEWLKREVERKKPVLVIIDTLFRFNRVADLNDYAKVSAA
jgi:predicted ATP-dependent serine protease